MLETYFLLQSLKYEGPFFGKTEETPQIQINSALWERVQGIRSFIGKSIAD